MPEKIPLERELAGLPELEAFPTTQEQENALRTIAERHENPYDWHYWLWAAILAVSAVSGAWLIIRLLRMAHVPRPLSVALGVVAGFAIHSFLYRAVHRWAARPALREELSKLAIASPSDRPSN